MNEEWEINPVYDKTVLVDADTVAYRAGFGANKDEDTLVDAYNKVDTIVRYIIGETSLFTDESMYHWYLSGSNNFRYEVKKNYKENRKDLEKPKFIDEVRAYLIDEYQAEVTEGQEADDIISIHARELDYDCVIATIDKDFIQIPCPIFNYGRGKWYQAPPFDGLKFFYTQILTGDAVDNIKGLYNIGPKKAEKLLEGCQTEQDLYQAVLKAYENDVDQVIQNARLLWLRDYPDEMWEPPSV